MLVTGRVVVVVALAAAVRVSPEAGVRVAAEVKLLPYERVVLLLATRVVDTRSPSTRVATGNWRALVMPPLRSENERPGFATA